MHVVPRRLATIVCALALLPWAVHGRESGRRTAFAAEIERLSEPEGDFDTDNLISNERRYLDVIPALTSKGIRGGAYIGVGPDQNFSYIARVRPVVAYIIDVRRDNLLLHLLFKSLFARSHTRVEYLSELTGRRLPPGEGWEDATIDTIVAYIDKTAASADVNALRPALESTLGSFGVPLTAGDMETIARFHRAFIDAGLSLQFHSHGRPANPSYPTFRDLLLARDRDGHSWNYLASEADFQFVRGLQSRDAIIPVVGNVNGSHALRAIGGAIADRRERVSTFYISNVENYLRRDGTYLRFLENLGHLPHDDRTLMIRSIFGGGGSASLVEPMNETVAMAGGRIR